MRHKLLAVVFSTALLTGGAYAAEDQNKDKRKHDPSTSSVEQTQETTKTTSSHTTKGKTETVIGEVKSYEAGKSIEVSTPGKIMKSRTFSLDDKDMTANVDPGVAVGNRVKVTLKTDNNGHKTLTVEPQTGREHAGSRK